ncbi:alpha-galactosidase MelA [soil metagenome]
MGPRAISPLTSRGSQLSKVRVAFLGAGSYVFGPTLISQCVVENRIPSLSWRLFDPDFESVAVMASIGEKLASTEGIDVDFSAFDDPDKALAGADFVVCSAAVEMNRRFQVDRAIIEKVYPRHLITEFGGVYGIASSLRQMAMISDIARRIRRQCPDAWLLDISNPLPRVCQIAHLEGVKTVGFCSVSISGFGRLHEIFGGPPTSYPFHEAQDRFTVQMGGTNHLSWLIELHDRATGEDLMDELRARLQKRKDHVRSKCEAYGRTTGFMLMSGDDHVQDFLPLDGYEHSLASVSHGSDEERMARLRLLSDVAKGRREISELKPKPSWERPSDFIQAMMDGSDASFMSLNLVNEGQIPNLPPEVFVETAVSIKGRSLLPRMTTLPESVLPYSRLAVEINRSLANAFRSKALRYVNEAVEMDPTIQDKEKGRNAVRDCLSASEDVIGCYA